MYAAFECRTVDALVAIGSNGRVYSVPVAQLPSARGDGAPVTSMIDLAPASRLVGYIAGAPTTPLLLATTNGYGFSATLGDLISRQKGGKQFISVDDDAEPLRPQTFDPASDRHLMCLSAKGRVLVFDLADVKAQPGHLRGFADDLADFDKRGRRQMIGSGALSEFEQDRMLRNSMIEIAAQRGQNHGKARTSQAGYRLDEDSAVF